MTDLIELLRECLPIVARTEANVYPQSLSMRINMAINAPYHQASQGEQAPVVSPKYGFYTSISAAESSLVTHYYPIFITGPYGKKAWLEIVDGKLVGGGDMPVDEAAKQLMQAIGAQFLQEQPLQGWQPIETAPKDGTLILLFRATTDIISGYMSCGEWTEHDGGYWTTDFAEAVSRRAMMAGQPTHWMPLPATPAVPSSSG